MITHHPDDECLWALASGQLDSGRGLLLSVHVDGCQRCHGRVQSLLSVGGEVLARSQPAELSDNALQRALKRIESAAPEGKARVGATSASTSHGLRRLDGCEMSSWRKVAPGMRFRSVLVPYATDGKMFVLGIAPGRSLPKHSHRDIEWTQVIGGAFDDGRARFEAGDFDATDGSVRHQPVVTSKSECICLAHLSAPLVFESWIARAFGRWIGM